MPVPVRKQLLDRGVWEAPYLLEGNVRVLIAINRRGVTCGHVKLRAGVDEERASAYLLQQLERVDPDPVLRLVQPTRPMSTRPAREIDPRLYTDPRSPLSKRRYLVNLGRAAASRLPDHDR